MSTLDRRLPIYLLLDVSESMVGPPMDAVNDGLRLLCQELRTDPMAIETAWVSVITFARAAKQVVQLTDVTRFAPPPLDVGPGTTLGAAFDTLAGCLSREVRKSSPTQKGDYKPIVFLLTDGSPTDAWEPAVQRFKAAHPSANLIALGYGRDADLALLRRVTPNVLSAASTTGTELKQFFKWVSSSVALASAQIGGATGGLGLPPPPSGLAGGGGGGGSPPAEPSQVVLAAHCKKDGRGYLMRYAKAGDKYVAAGAHPVGADYFAESAGAAAGRSLDSSRLDGSPPCPYCGNPGWTATPAGVLVCHESVTAGGRGGRTQVVFVLDVTGSMQGEIDGVTDGINDFMDHIHAKGLAVEVGLVAFRDLQEHEPPEVLSFAGQAFTADPDAFRDAVDDLTAWGGGGNAGESSFDGLVTACRQPWDPAVSARVLVLITDEPPLMPDGGVRGPPDVTAAMVAAGVTQLHVVIPDHLRPRYAALHDRVKGEVFELDGSGRGGDDFRDILIDVGTSISVATRLG